MGEIIDPNSGEKASLMTLEEAYEKNPTLKRLTLTDEHVLLDDVKWIELEGKILAAHKQDSPRATVSALVVACGPGRLDPLSGQHYKMNTKPGDRVVMHMKGLSSFIWGNRIYMMTLDRNTIGFIGEPIAEEQEKEEVGQVAVSA